MTFAGWYRAEGTLDIHSIVTRRREVFYWLAVIFTFAMGTALGDLFATAFHLGYLASALVFTAAICVPLIAWRLGASPVLTFWVAYILTRPIGASFADFFGMPKDISGMGFGHGAVSVVTLILVVAFSSTCRGPGLISRRRHRPPDSLTRTATVAPSTRSPRIRSRTTASRSTTAACGRTSPGTGTPGTGTSGTGTAGTRIRGRVTRTMRAARDMRARSTGISGTTATELKGGGLAA